MTFCFKGEPELRPLFGVAQNGGLAMLYPYDLVWFVEPDGSECWARMD